MGRKLDRWVAENIFDIKTHLDSFGEPCVRATSGYWQWNRVKKYTSDLNEAIKIAEKLNLCLLFFDQIGLVVYKDENDASNDYESLHTMLGCHAYTICLAAYKLKTGCDWEE